MGNRSILGALVAGASLSLAGCDDDLTSIRITLGKDGSGTVKVASVAVPEPLGAAESAIRGALWSNRVSVNALAGAFDDVSQLAVAGITFSRAVHDGCCTLEVVVPLGTNNKWAAVLAPLSETQRTELAQVIDPSGKTKSIGSSLKIIVELPGEVVSSGALPGSDGISASHKAKIATLTVPVGATVSYHDSVKWHMTWNQQEAGSGS